MHSAWRSLWVGILAVACGSSVEAEAPAPGHDGGVGGSGVDAGATDAELAEASADGGAGPDGASQDAAPPDAEPKPTARVLFIGNSYTSVNDLPKTLAQLSESGPSPVVFAVAAHTPGGTTWEDHDADPSVAQLIQQGWDYVVLQDQSQQPWVYPWGTKPALLSLAAKADAVGAKPALFMTWARNTTSPYPPTRFQQEMAVSHYYSQHAAAANALVAPVGRAWERALRDPSLTLHAADGSHPNELGTYLAACVLYATLTDASPVGLGSGGLPISAADQVRLQQVAWDTHIARKRLAPPAVGVWPLSAGVPGNDLVPHALTLGDVVGPGGAAQTATALGTDKYGAIPYFPGLNAPRLTVAFFAHREDWSVPTTTYEVLLAKSWGYQIQQFQQSLEVRLYTVDQNAFPYPQYDVAYLSPGWHHFALTYDGASYALWVDAVPVVSATATGDVLYGGALDDKTYDGVAIGAHTVDTVFSGANPSAMFTGALSDLRIFDQALGKTELQKLSGVVARRELARSGLTFPHPGPK